MLDHVSIGVVDAARSKRFYDAILSPLGYRCISAAPDSLGYGDQTVALWVNEASHPVPADKRSGLHFCFTAPSRQAVDAFHRAAFDAGGHDNGRPGLRPDYADSYYAAFVIDPDGYRLEAHYGRS